VSRGRNDLYLQLGREALCIEAKRVSAEMPEDAAEWKRFWKRVQLHLRAARREAVRARARQSLFQHRVGLVFCILGISRRHIVNIEDRRRRFARTIRKQSELRRIDFWAVYLPSISEGSSEEALLAYRAVFLLGSCRA
jgi:hypothetical protein